MSRNMENRRAYQREWRNARYAAWVAEGKCGRCSKPAIPGRSLCTKCRQRIIASNHRRDANKPKKHCGACGDKGHNRATCNARGCLVAERLGVPCRTCAVFMGLRAP